MIGPTSRAGDIARTATDRIDAFYVLGGEEKRLRAADEGLAQLAQVDGFAPAAAVVSATVQAVDDRPARIAASRAALVEIATHTAVLVAGTSPLASLALATIAGLQGEPRERAAAAAFAALPAEPYTGWIATLADTRGENRLRMAQEAPAGSLEAQAARGADLAGLAGRRDVDAVVRHCIAGLPQEPQVDLLSRLAAVPDMPSAGLVAGLRAIAGGGDVGREVVRACDDDTVAAEAGRIALAARPREGWRLWAEPLLGAGDASDAAVLRTALTQRGACDLQAVAEVVPRLTEAVKADLLITSLENELARARSPRAADVAALRAACGRQGVSGEACLAMAAELAQGEQPLTAQRLAALVNTRLDRADDDALACGMLREAAALKGADAELAAVMAAPLQLPMADEAQHGRAAREALAVLADGVPQTLGGIAAACQRQAESLAWPEDGLRALQATFPLLARYAKSPEDAEIVRLLASGAGLEAYEAGTVLRGVGQAVAKLAREDEPARLPEVAGAMAGYMNYWVDEARAARAGVEAIERLAQAGGDPVRAACARFLLRLDDQVDVSNENERSKALIAGIEWLGENTPTRLQGGLGELARHLRSVNEDDMRDVRTGQMAADMMAEAAAASHDTQLAAEAALLRILAGRHAENVGERRNALFEAMEVQRTDDSDGAQRLARMGKAAVAAYEQPMEDKAQVARACLEQIGTLDRAAAPAAEALAGWTRLRLYGDGARGVVAEQVMEAFAARPRVAPGAVAEAARNVLDAIEAVNAPLFEEAALTSVEQVARGLGDERYVPEVVAATRATVSAGADAGERRERLLQGLEELARFQGDTFDQVVAASRLERSGASDARIEKADGEVVIGGVRVPRKA